LWTGLQADSETGEMHDTKTRELKNKKIQIKDSEMPLFLLLIIHCFCLLSSFLHLIKIVLLGFYLFFF